MKHLILSFFLLLPIAVFAQPKGYKAVANLVGFQQSLAQASKNAKSIQSDFKQTKVMAMLADRINSKGVFYFLGPDKVRIEYTSPFNYLLVMNGGGVLVKDDQKTTKVNTKNSKTMQSVNRIMMDCMRGSVFSNPDFKTTVYENTSGYLLSMKPATASMQKMFQSIDIYLNKTFDVTRLVMTEQGGDYSQMDFSGTKHNVALNDALFRVK